MKERIRVSTGKIREMGSEWEEMVKRAETDIQTVEEEIGQIDVGFHCQAVLQIQEALHKLTEEGRQRLEDLRSHVEKLQDIAGNYEEAERKNELGIAGN